MTRAATVFRALLGLGLGLGMLSSGAAAQSANENALLDRPARLEAHDLPIGDALVALQRASGVALAFSNDLLPPMKRIECDCTDVTVGSALRHILEGTDLVFEAGRRQVLIGRKQPAPVARALAGQVVDAEAGSPVRAAEVSVVGAGIASLTDDSGHFLLEGADRDAGELLVTALGYEARTLRVDGSGGPARVELTRKPIPLEEIVIAPGSFGVLEVSPALIGSTVSREDIEAIPQFGDDVFRTLKRMPGVFADDISTKLNVRGGTARDLLVRLDGLELYEPYHLKDLDGALGIVDVQSLGGVDLVTGGFPAEYGDKTAGVFNMRSRPAPTIGTRTTLGMSLSSVSAISQGSFADQKGQWLVSLRRGFLEYVLAVGGVDDDLNPRYWDALGRVQYLLGDGHLVWFEMLHAGDDLDWTDQQTESSVTSRWTNSYLWSGWKATLSPRIRLEALASVGRLTRHRAGSIDNPDGGAFTPLTGDIDDQSTFQFGGLKQDWQLDLADDLMLKVGGELRTTSGTYDYFSATTRYDLDHSNQLYVRADSNTVQVDPHGAEVGSYVSLRGRVGSRFTWETGIRHDWREHTGDNDLAPRALIRYDLLDHTNVRASYGRYFQSQGLDELAAQDGQRTFAPSEMAEQLAVGVEHDLGNGTSVRLEGYRRTITSPLPIFVNLSRAVNPFLEVESDRRRLDPTEARARGLELILAHDGTGPVSWSASYALASAEDRIDGAWAPRTLDQRHTLNLRSAYRVGDRWQLSGAWSYHTGWPFTEQFLDVETGLSQDGTQTVDVVRRGFADYNAERLPAYHRLDLRVTRSFALAHSRLEVFLDVFNAYDRTNLRGYEWYLRRSQGTYSAARDTGEEQLPILPTIGFRWVF